MTPPRTPTRLPPRGSWDCHVHVFGDPAVYPPRPGAAYDPPAATLADLDAMHAALGIGHAVLVQPTVYGTDHRLLLDSLAKSPRLRGVAVVDDSVSDDELQRLHHAGVRGARFVFGGPAGGAPTREAFERSVARIERLGWHAKIGGAAAGLVKHADWLRGLALPAVIDHLAGITHSEGPGQPAFQLALELLKRENWWVLVSNGDRRSTQGKPWSDVVPFIQAYADAAPDRTLWATDWPHLLYAKALPGDADLLELLYRCVPDEKRLERILVENPRRLYG